MKRAELTILDGGAAPAPTNDDAAAAGVAFLAVDAPALMRVDGAAMRIAWLVDSQMPLYCCVAVLITRCSGK